MAEIKIDSQLFQERISHFVSSWKNDARSKEGLFNGASSIIILMGKAEDSQDFHKNNAMHVGSPNPSQNSCFLPFITFQLLCKSFFFLCPFVFWLTSLLVLVAGIRVPRNVDAFHDGLPLHCHDSQER